MISIPQRLKELRERAGLSMADLAKAVGMKGASSYQRYESEDLFQKKVLPLDLAQRIAGVLSAHGIAHNEVLALAGLDWSKNPLEKARIAQLAEGAFNQGRIPAIDALHAPINIPGLVIMDLPLLGMAEANNSKDYASFSLAEKPMRMVERPPHLVNVSDAFAVYVIGQSMHPRYKQGEVVYINPLLPCRPGDDVLVKLTDGSVLIKELVREDGDKTIFRQHNPAKEIALKKSTVAQIMRIAGTSGV